ncbi:polyphosphate polymerase domain-containing protein [Actomonas aquatica]|uniref:Polyphosphate polymerase domain-containing protein n=1 Tax=Actomonas aquatica TaxID=2866162 RepID=A0ABZ1CEY0_9BACT|nr:polyphosphate polymerase domain-containing protein [Opitutus sp. WL0086]WRQ89154.1 polyphosphate polymerase domain-containing protein [Opitutus sp. WL0086]
MDASQSREEYKFLLPADLAESVRAQIAEHLPADQGSPGGYDIVSDYFDNAERLTYWQKLVGHPNRRRIRTRTYLSSKAHRQPAAFIEIKHKLLDDTVKRRIPVPAAFLDERDPAAPLVLPPIDEDDSQPRSQWRARAELEELLAKGFNHPVVRIWFHRHAYDAGRTGRLRVTFDSQLRWQPLAELAGDLPPTPRPLFGPGETIMEVKTAGAVPYWFRSLVAQHRLVPRGTSKYARALQHLNPSTQLVG